MALYKRKKEAISSQHLFHVVVLPQPCASGTPIIFVYHRIYHKLDRSRASSSILYEFIQFICASQSKLFSNVPPCIY